MFRNYTRSALRLLTKEKLYVFINALGLSVGMAASFLIFSWVQKEFSYDTFHPDHERLYRVVTDWKDQSEGGMATTYPMIRNRVLSQFPEVAISARLFHQGFLGSKTRIANGDKVLTNLRFFYGDSSALSLFGFQVVTGEARGALSRPNTMVLTRSAAMKFFGEEDPVGKTLRIGEARDMEITAVIEDLPENSHVRFDVLATMLSHPWIKGAEDNLWSGIVFHTYVKLSPGASPEALENKMARVLDNFPDDPDHVGRGLDLRLQPVSDIHLTSNRKFELEANGNIRVVYLFVTIAVLVLGVAMVNYVNLTTARHTQRYREVGVRKVLGASRGQLVSQFITESMGVALLAFGGAVLVVEIVRPVLIDLAGGNVFYGSILDPEVLLVAGIVAVVIAIITAILPAWGLASFDPVSLFRPLAVGQGKGMSFRKILIIAQFTVSILLTVCTAITYRQMRFMQNAALGYTKDHVLVLDISLPGPRGNFEVLKGAFADVPGVLGVTAASQLPTDIQTGENIDVSPSQSQGVYCVSVDNDFFDVMGIPLRATGPGWDSFQPNDTVNRFVLNRSAVASLGWTDDQALGRPISIRHGNQEPGPVLGVADDFHFQSLHSEIGPLAVEFNPGSFQYVFVKMRPEALSSAIPALAAAWQRVAGGIPFDYQFLDEQYSRLYRAEQRSGALFLVFAAIALFISLLGLFGLASFVLERRTKEMGLRKILGAGAWGVAALVMRDFLYLTGIAFAVALPMAFWFRESWLAQFAFRADTGMGTFLLCGLLNLALAGLALVYHTFRISRVNPVETLRYE